MNRKNGISTYLVLQDKSRSIQEIIHISQIEEHIEVPVKKN